MSKNLIILLTLLLFATSGYAKKKAADTDAEVTVTFLVMMDKDAKSKISKALDGQDGILSSKIDTQKQEVVVTFDAYKNTVSNLQKMFKEAGYTASALEVGCFGSPEGCLNAKHYINNSMP